jgi:hypothetical protein
MKNIVNYYPALAALHIWDPCKMDFIRDRDRRNQRKLFYRAMGLVQHDRFLNDDPRAGTSGWKNNPTVDRGSKM